MDNPVAVHHDKFKVELHADGTFLVVRSFRTPITLDIAIAFTRQFTELGSKEHVRRCLVDMRPTHDGTSVRDKLDYAFTKASEAGLDTDWRVAALKRKEDATPDLIEAVMTGAGYRFQLFDDQVEALEWLGVLPRS